MAPRAMAEHSATASQPGTSPGLASTLGRCRPSTHRPMNTAASAAPRTRVRRMAIMMPAASRIRPEPAPSAACDGQDAGTGSHCRA